MTDGPMKGWFRFVVVATIAAMIDSMPSTSASE
jgi:hypothetical protein